MADWLQKTTALCLSILVLAWHGHAFPEKTLQNPLAWSNTDSQLFKDQSHLDSLYAAMNDTRQKADLTQIGH